MKIPEFEPAIARVLEAVGRILIQTPKGTVDGDGVARQLQADDDTLAGELSKDPHRVQSALEQLRSDGLLEAVPSGSEYRLTSLGRARVTQSPQED